MRLFNVRVRKPGYLLAFACAACCGRNFALAQEIVGPTTDEPSIVGCGKGQILEARLKARLLEQLEMERSGIGGVAEAMTDTDVLQNELNVELSSLNPGTDSCTISGSNRITIQSKSATLTEFTIRLRNTFTISSVLINDVTPATVTTLSSSSRKITLDRPYGLDEVLTITINYSGITADIGLGSFEVATHGPSSAIVASSLSEPYYAYTWWPSKDGDVNVPGDNSDKALLDIKVTAPNNYSVASNGLLQGVVSLGGNRNQYHWASSYPITTYLVSLSATNYNSWTQAYSYPGGTMPVEFFIYPELDNASNRASWEKVINMMTVFRPLFGEYPFINEKYGLYYFPFGGGMEHQTITGVTGFSESLLSHELTHQWWGDMITCKTWSDIWLNEGFATYGEALWDEFKSGFDNQSVLMTDMINRKPISFDGSVYVYPADTSNAFRIFSTDFSYRKAGWVLHQLRHVVGDATFFQILANYRAAHIFGSATTDDFVASASATYGQDLTWFFTEMVYDRGAPNYRLSWDSVTVGAQEYLHLQIDQTQQQTTGWPAFFTMPIDIVATINGTPQTFVVHNNARSQRFVLPVSATTTAVQLDPQQWILRGTTQTATLVVGDLNADNHVDSNDYSLFAACFSGSGQPYGVGCVNGDFDGDGDIDCVDWAGFKSAWTAGGQPPTLPQCDAQVPPDAPLNEPSPVDKNRFISFVPQNPGVPTAIRVTLVSLQHPDPPNIPQDAPPDFSAFEGQVRWVGPPTVYCESGGVQPCSVPGDGTFVAASLQCNPNYTNWSSVTGGGVLHVTGVEIVPSSTFTIEAFALGCQGNEGSCAFISPGLDISTARWGDVIPPYQAASPAPLSQPDISDVAAVVDKFRMVTSAETQPLVRMQPNSIPLSSPVNIADVAADVDAFRNLPYPYPGPASCP
ncbi:MAG: hypothetical protein HY287_17725 [Planctomycetes bacterium]|nr:hypothetical protein [Planctomycetota bacterium]MBI3836163.1 hypothetical protein [Planctomycetota bacterium]